MTQSAEDKRRYGSDWNTKRLYMLIKAQGKCQQCHRKNGDRVLRKPSQVRLAVHHRDGNVSNDSESNLEVLCQSCHLKRRPRTQIPT